MYLALLSRQMSSLRTAGDRCCPSIPAYSARGGVRQKRSRSRLAAQVSMEQLQQRRWAAYVLEEAQQVGNSFPLAVGQHWVIYAVSRAACQILSASSHGEDLGRLTAAAEESVAEVGDAHGWRRRRSQSGRVKLVSGLQVQPTMRWRSEECVQLATGDRLGRCDGLMSLVMLSPAPGC